MFQSDLHNGHATNLPFKTTSGERNTLTHSVVLKDRNRKKKTLVSLCLVITFSSNRSRTKRKKQFCCETQVLETWSFDECQKVAILQNRFNFKSKDLSLFFLAQKSELSERIEILLISDLPRIEVFCWNVFVYFQSIISCFSPSLSFSRVNQKQFIGRMNKVSSLLCAAQDWNIEGTFIVQNYKFDFG